MTRARALWLGLLALGLVLALALRTSRPTRSAPESRPAAPSTPPSADESEEFEIEVTDPGEGAPDPDPKGAVPTGKGEPELIRGLAASWENQPERALELANAGERQFGESPHAVERRLYEIKALVKLGRIGSARTKAESYLAKYPPGPMTDEVERLTGVHRRPEPEKAP